MEISLIIPTHNRAKLLEQALLSMRELRIPEGVRVEFVLVANACSDITEEVAEAVFSQLPFPCRCVVEPVPGLSVARNRGVAEARYEWIAFLDDDVLVEPGWLEGMIAPIQHSNADISSGRVLLWWKDVERPSWFTPSLESFLSQRDLGDQIIPILDAALVMGGNFAFRKSLMDEIGGFRTDLGRTGKGLLAGEETDLVQRAFDCQKTAYYAPDAILHHWVPPERITPEYLLKAAFGRGYSNVILKPSLSFVAWARSLAGHCWLAMYEGVRGILENIFRKPDGGINRRVRSAIGRGGLLALLHRILGKSI